MKQDKCQQTIHSGGHRLTRTDGVYSIRCCQFEAMVAGAGTRPTNERVGRVIVLEKYPVLNPAKCWQMTEVIGDRW